MVKTSDCCAAVQISIVYTRIWKKSYRGSEAPENHVIIKESVAWRLELVDSDALELAFFRQRQQMMTEATIGAGTRHTGLYKKGKIRVQVILNQEYFHYAKDCIESYSSKVHVQTLDINTKP